MNADMFSMNQYYDESSKGVHNVQYPIKFSCVRQQTYANLWKMSRWEDYFKKPHKKKITTNGVS